MSAATVDMRPVATIIRPMLTPSRALDQWLDDLERRKYAAETLRRYSEEVGRFVDSLPVDLDVTEIREEHVTAHFATWRTLKKGSQATNESRVRAWFGWLAHTNRITVNPCDRILPTRAPDPESLDVVEITPDDVQRMMFLAETWPERLCIGVLAGTGARRSAASRARFADYNRGRGEIRFREKGGKWIWKPVPAFLDALIEQAVAAGVYADQPYLIPSPGTPSHGERAASIIYRLVKDVARRAGVEAHPHALRAAFACFYLETHPGDTEALRLLLGHQSLNTTQVYLRKQNKQAAMERVRDLSWVSPTREEVRA